MRRETQNILLLLLGGALLKLASTGDYLRYVKPAQQPWLLTAGTVMLALAVIAIAQDIASAHPEPAEHRHSGSRAVWLLLLPVLAIFLVAPPALGADSVTRTAGRAQTPGTADFPPLPRASPFDTSLSDFSARAGWDRAHALEGRPVRLTGFVAHRGADTYVARLVITCCAADAYPVKVKVTGAHIESQRDDAWIEATVLLVPGSSTRANQWTASATVTEFRQIPEPEDPYEH